MKPRFQSPGSWIPQFQYIFGHGKLFSKYGNIVKIFRPKKDFIYVDTSWLLSVLFMFTLNEWNGAKKAIHASTQPASQVPGFRLSHWGQKRLASHRGSLVRFSLFPDNFLTWALAFLFHSTMILQRSVMRLLWRYDYPTETVAHCREPLRDYEKKSYHARKHPEAVIIFGYSGARLYWALEKI